MVRIHSPREETPMTSIPMLAEMGAAEIGVLVAVGIAIALLVRGASAKGG